MIYTQFVNASCKHKVMELTTCVKLSVDADAMAAKGKYSYDHGCNNSPKLDGFLTAGKVNLQ